MIIMHKTGVRENEAVRIRKQMRLISACERGDDMGTYLNPGKVAYEEAVHSEIFVDKTEMIRYLKQ